MATGKRRSETRPVSACAERGRARSSGTRRADVVATDRGASGAEGRDPPSSARRVRSSRSERSSVGPGDAWDRGARVPRERADRGRAIAYGRASTSRASIARGPAARQDPPRGASRAREWGTSRHDPAGLWKVKIARGSAHAGDAFAPAEGLLGAHGQDGGAEASHLSCRLGGVGCRTEVECASMAPKPGHATPIKSGCAQTHGARMCHRARVRASSALIGGKRFCGNREYWGSIDGLKNQPKRTQPKPAKNFCLNCCLPSEDPESGKCHA